MFHGPTELLWIGCLLGLIWNHKIKSVTLTPRTNSQTCRLKGISHVMFGTIFFILLNISHASSTCCTKNFSLISCWTQNQKEEGVVPMSRPAVMNLSSFIAISPSAASSPIASESPGMPMASGKPDSRMSVEPSSFDAASTSQVRLKDAYLGGLMEEQGGDPTHQEEENSEDLDYLAAGTWCCKGELVAQNNKAWGKPLCTRSQFFSWPGKPKECGSDVGPLSPHLAGHIALHGSRLHHGQEDRWQTTRRSYGIFECEFGYLVNVHEYHSSRSSSSRKRLWHEFETCKELSLENNRTASQRNRKADQWSDRNHWHKPDQFPRFEVGIDKLIAQSSLSNIPLPRSTSFPTRCCVWWKWETILLNPERSKFNGTQKTITSANWIELMDNLWNSSGRFSQDSLQWQSSTRFSRWWEHYSVNQRISQDHLHVNVKRHCMGCKGKWWKMCE